MERMEKVIDRPWGGVKNALANSPGNWEERTSFLFLFLFFFFFLDRGGSIYGRVMFAGFLKRWLDIVNEFSSSTSTL